MPTAPLTATIPHWVTSATSTMPLYISNNTTTTSTSTVMVSNWGMTINYQQPWQATSAQVVTPACERLTAPGYEQRCRNYEREARDRRARRQAATERAEALLLEWLTPAQAADHRRRRRFDVVSDQGNRWRIRTDYGHSGNVELVDASGGTLAVYCAHPDGVPSPDAWLAQALTLETCEAEFLAAANIHHDYRNQPRPRIDRAEAGERILVAA